MTALRGHAARTSQRRPVTPFLAMRVYGDTMHGVHITIGWRKGNEREGVHHMAFTTHEMLQKLRQRLERYLR
jgi:hypothetical protein